MATAKCSLPLSASLVHAQLGNKAVRGYYALRGKRYTLGRRARFPARLVKKQRKGGAREGRARDARCAGILRNMRAGEGNTSALRETVTLSEKTKRWCAIFPVNCDAPAVWSVVRETKHVGAFRCTLLFHFCLLLYFFFRQNASSCLKVLQAVLRK